jgi:hypothetical protein
MTWELDLIIALFTPIALSFLRPNNKASYLQSCLCIEIATWLHTKLSLFQGEIITATVPAPKDPCEPSQNTVHTTSFYMITSSYGP